MHVKYITKNPYDENYKLNEKRFLQLKPCKYIQSILGRRIDYYEIQGSGTQREGKCTAIIEKYNN